MQIGILHLSDVHLVKETPALDARVKVIAGSLVAAEPTCSGYLILLSGDLAFSGKPEQYAQVGKLISEIKSDLSNSKSKPSVFVAMIPGNNDCNFAHDSDTRRMAIDYLQSKMDSFDVAGDLASRCLAVQDDYFAFQAAVMPETIRPTRERFIWQHIFAFGDVSIVVNCLNTAWLSQIDEDQAHLLMPVAAIRHVVSSPSVKNDLVITLLLTCLDYFIILPTWVIELRISGPPRTHWASDNPD